MRLLPFVLSSLLALALLVVLSTQLGTVPPLGAMLSPSHGFWQNAEPRDQDFSLQIESSLLKDGVQVYLDERLVPHVFATNDTDAYFVQGYLHARFRLWQMQFQAMAAAGRLCEIFGEKVGNNSVLEKHDRRFRRMGMMLAAENSLKAMEAVPGDKELMEAYAAGVNHYIEQLSPAQYPIEFKMLNYKPERWTPLHSALFLKYMSYDLASDFDDFETGNLLQQLGLDGYKKVMPLQPDSLEPILPKSTPFLVSTPVPQRPEGFDSLLASDPSSFGAIQGHRPDPDNGSNNWVIGPSRSASGRPILCNDPHLGLNLPSLWYEIQITTPEYNVYGVSFPGAPSVVIGFNDSIAWGVTNSRRDVMDFYEVQFRDSTMNEYLYNGSWKTTVWRTETIRIRGKADFTDRLPITVWGPVMYDETFPISRNDNRAIAIRWKAIDNSLELGAFRGLNHSKNYDDYLAAIRLFMCPGQNFVFAAKNGRIAWWQQAHFPAKWRYQGDFIMPGTDSSYRWQGFIANEDNIHQIDPERGFVSSANQLPADTSYPFYLGGRHDVYRGLIINRMLYATQAATPDDMKRMQTDNYNVFGEMAVPLLLKNVLIDSLNETAKNMLDLVKGWNYRADADSKGQTVFFNWWNEFAKEVWSDELTRKDGLPTAWPQDNTLFEAIARDSAFVFIDNVNTPDTESLQIVVTRGLQKATEIMVAKKDLTWGAWKDTRVSHLLSGLPAFSRLHLRMGGGSKIINATKDTHGPSWRVVVHMTDKTEAYGVYPGGQSGNPGSRFYDSFIDAWASGNYNKLWIMDASEKNANGVKWIMRFSKP